MWRAGEVRDRPRRSASDPPGQLHRAACEEGHRARAAGRERHAWFLCGMTVASRFPMLTSIWSWRITAGVSVDSR
eukprot:586461-Hanusia_phi.AAC.1